MLGVSVRFPPKSGVISTPASETAHFPMISRDLVALVPRAFAGTAASFAGSTSASRAVEWGGNGREWGRQLGLFVENEQEPNRLVDKQACLGLEVTKQGEGT